MNKELLNNPEVKTIALKYADKIGYISGDDTAQILWENFVKENTKMPLFTTTDGKDIYEGDTYFALLFSGGVLKFKATDKSAYSDRLVGLTPFSNLKAAEDFHLLNRPTISIQKLLDIGAIVKGSPQYNQILEAVKEL